MYGQSEGRQRDYLIRDLEGRGDLGNIQFCENGIEKENDLLRCKSIKPNLQQRRLVLTWGVGEERVRNKIESVVQKSFKDVVYL